MVIVGAAGSGKSTLALMLALGLLTDWQVGQPVPLLVSVASWDPDREHLSTWLADWLVETYSGLANPDRYGTDVASHLVSGDRILPILDGLDEITADRRARALDEIDRAVAGDRPFVLTCRTDEFNAAAGHVESPLSSATVLELQPLTRQQLATYLGTAADESRWRPVTSAMADPDDPLAVALSTPLMATLARRVYAPRDCDPGQLLDRGRFPDACAIQQHLIDAYLPSVYTDTPAAPGGHRAFRVSPARAQRWLTTLAREAQADPAHVLAWWRLSRNPGRSSRLAVAGALGALVAGLTVFTLRREHTFDGLVFIALAGGAAFALGAGVTYRQRMNATDHSGERTPRPASVAWLALAGLVGLVCGLAIGLVSLSLFASVFWTSDPHRAIEEDLIYSAALVIVPGLSAGLAAGLALRYGGSRPPSRIVTELGIHSDWRRILGRWWVDWCAGQAALWVS
jgi:hypothetical protein